MNNLRAKNVMYEQQLKHLPCTVDELVNKIETQIKPDKYAFIVHDKDRTVTGDLVESHLHGMMSFKNARYINSLAKQLNDNPQQFEVWRGSSQNGYAYLTHRTTNAQSKFQYSPSDVIANFDYVKELTQITNSVKKASCNADTKLLLDGLLAGTLTKKEVEDAMTGSQYGRAKRQIQDVYSQRLRIEASMWREQMLKSGKQVRVLWLYGSAGTGKTSFARDLAMKENRPYFITGSSRDMFQGYEGQHTIILDELRPHSIRFSDLLKITDPYSISNEVMAPSRYFDKPLSVDLIIITSPYSPRQYYNKAFGIRESPWMISYDTNQVDSFEQLDRRIMLTMKMTPDEIIPVEFDYSSRDYINLPNANIQKNTYSTYARGIVSTSTDEKLEEYNKLFS